MISGGVCSEILDNELENVEEDKLENVDLLDPPCCYSVGGGGSSGVLEREYSEEDDSDEEYDSIQRPAFLVEGEPNFDSGPPEDGLEYLRRVRWEAAHIPKVTVAKPDSSKPKREQSVYMPQIPDIAECPEHLVPSRQWEDAFLVDFSKLRWCLTQNDGSSSKISPEQQLVVIFPETDISSPQLIKSNVLEKFSKLSTDEVHSCKPTDNSTVEGNGIGQAPLLDAKESKILASPQSTTSQSIDIDDSCTYPVLSAILAMDSVARVSTLRKRVSLAETMSTLSKNDCVWLFALCMAIDTPLNADTCAALRSLLRKCASLRAAKSELDDEVIMLNILATIAGKYFGQSET
uniref:Uncharacterized protein MANES_11G116000 n=1 Tax=Rhizophora mucronata TaxID=61149 RepID=A0A2P2LWV1_RHIMU